MAIIFMFQGIGSPRVDASPAKDEDFGYWSVNDIEKKLSDRWKIKAGEELRFRNHQGLYYEETNVGASFRAYNWITLGALYLQVRNTRTQGKKDIWYWTSEPRLYATLQQSYKGFTLEDRNMICFRFNEGTPNTFQYRNMVTLTAPWKWTRFEFQPYTANEIFIGTHRKGMYEDRFYSGFKMHLWGPAYGSIFYLRNSTKNSIGKWTSLNILGTGIKISF